MVELEESKRKRSQLDDDWPLAARRFLQDNIFHHGSIHLYIQDQPFQFILCGVIQLGADIVLIGQTIIYGKSDYF